MALNIKTVYDGGEPIEFDRDVLRERLDLVKGYSFASYHIKGSVFSRAEVVRLAYNGEFVLNAECDRCLKPFERRFCFEEEHILVRSSENDNDEFIVTEGDCIDLDEIAVCDALLLIPAKLLCRDDCKGLCCICGADLNLGDCGCNTPQQTR